LRRALQALFVSIALTACGGGGGGGGGGGTTLPPAVVTLSATPTSLTLGQSSSLSWTSNTGTSCMASGSWSGARADTGTEVVTPAASGSLSYTLVCTGGSYSDSSPKSVTLTVAPASAFSATGLVANLAGAGAVSTDAKLTNGWGIAFGPTSPVWVANNHSNTSTLYDGNGIPQPFSSPRVVALPPGAGAVSFDPTGIVFNGGTDFVVTAGALSAPARFIFDGEGGMLAGWAPTVDAANAVVVYTATDGAVYKGLAVANNGSANFLYAADFRNNKIDVFNVAYQKQTTSASVFAFVDPALPANYAPFGIQAVKNGAGGSSQIYVAYAKKAAPTDADETSAAGLGLVSVFDANGNFVKRLVDVGGRLNSPWGMALAPADFGTLSGALLVGNFGDGKINGFDASTGSYIGTVANAGGTPLVEEGLWGIAFGNDAANQPHNTLFFAAGPNSENNGAYGRIDLGATPPVLNTPPVVTLSAPSAGASVSGTVSLSASVTAQVSVAKVEFFVNGATSLGVSTTAPYSLAWDTTTVPNGAATVKAVATDVDGHLGTSADVNLTVANGVTVTLTQLQTLVFTPMCSSCHSGTVPAGGALPASMNLKSGHSFASLVNVASIEQGALKRVKPGDAANSYLIHKLEGSAGITGSRMPLGGPFLDAATMDMINAWINAGAPNN
jgi:uncharacterized protein (TIGR03118 family)